MHGTRAYFARLLSLLTLLATAAQGQPQRKALLPAPQSPPSAATIENGDMRLSARVLDQVVVFGGTTTKLRALVLEGLTDKATGETIDLRDSPIWRLDLRRLADMHPNTVPLEEWAEWYLIPSLDASLNMPPGLSSPLVWVDRTLFPDADAKIVVDSATSMRLLWTDLRVGWWYPGLRGRLDVTVHLSFPDATGPLQGSIDVELKLDDGGAIDVAALSLCFPELLLGDLVFGAEPEGSQRDDVLLSPFEHGFLIPDPIATLGPIGGERWGPDSYVFDFDSNDQVDATGDRARNFTYPGETSTQFMYYYDLRDPEDASEDWLYLSGDTITGFGRRPSVRGGGRGVYLGAHDPDVNTKRIVHTVEDIGGEARLRLAIRTYIEFRRTRLAELRATGIGQQGDVWQAYYQGPQSLHDDPAAGSPYGTDLHFAWPVVLGTLEGDWLDAAAIYRDFFVRDSRAIHRDPQDPEKPVRVLDLPDEILPDPYKHALAVIGLHEVTSDSPPPAGQPIDLQQADNVRRYLDFLRADFSAYQDPLLVDPPYYVVAHGEGMVSGDAANLGKAVKGAGNDNHTNDARANFGEFMRRLREPDPNWNPPSGWPGRILVAQNRDHGSLRTDDPNLDPTPLVARRETGEQTLRNSKSSLTGYARPEAVQNLVQRLDEMAWNTTVLSMVSGLMEGQVDVFSTAGQGSAVKPDYSPWVDSLPGATFDAGGVGGGDRWFERHDQMRADVMSLAPFTAPNQSPHLVFATERFNEAFLQRNLPAGHRQVFPVTAIDDDGVRPWHLFVFAEPVMLTTHLYHDFAVMVGDGVTFSEFYAMPKSVKLSGVYDERYFEQGDPLERAKGRRLSLYKLAREVIDGGLLSGLGIDVSDTMTFEFDDGSDLALSSPNDRICSSFSDESTAGEFDLARGDWGPGTPPVVARELLRARSQFRRFLIGGRRVRDPRIVDVAQDPDFYAAELFAKRKSRSTTWTVTWRSTTAGSTRRAAACGSRAW